MSKVTTHILDTSRGIPAANVKIKLEIERYGMWEKISEGYTDDDGRLRTLTPQGLMPGRYRMNAAVGAWFARQGISSLYCAAIVDFFMRETDTDLHLPLLISPYGWSTYRGN